MDRFLACCAQYIYNKHAANLYDICVVLPNRRAGIFFSYYLQRYIRGAVISPNIIQINELIYSYSDLYKGDQLKLISILYRIFKKHTKTSESFDDFYFWGEVLLSDFNDIDNYLVNAEDLYRNISDIKEIESHFYYLTDEQRIAISRFWNCLWQTERRKSSESFVNMWDKLYPVYRDFNAELEKRGFAYSGMIYRKVVDKLRMEGLRFKYGKYYVLGLNALNNCEKEVFRYLKKEQIVDFLWDYDSYYLEDKINKAGYFMRENITDFPQPADFSFSSGSFFHNKKIRMIAVSSVSGQAQEIPRFLESVNNKPDIEFDSTAIVLADESLLAPALNAIPPEIPAVNVTMGYPIINSVIYGFINLLINLLKNRKLNENNEVMVYHRFITDILNHQILRSIETDRVNRYLDNIKETNRLNILLSDLDFSPLHKLIFTTPSELRDFSNYFLDIMAALYDIAKDQDFDNKLLPELIYKLYLEIEKLKHLMEDVTTEGEISITESVFFRLFRQYIGNCSVSYEGEPLNGIQVMGILETRCLDFKNLIILGFNENKWPRTNSYPSFIPFNIRMGFGLPGPDDQESMYAYYFYRLIQRAENITTVHTTVKDEVGSGELSRYGFQLLYNSKFDVVTSNLVFPFLNDPPEPVVVRNTPRFIRALLEKNSRDNPLSPTAINTYIKCSLRFYFRYILQLPEPDEIKDEIDSPVFGSIFHEAMEQLYRPFMGKIVKISDLENLSKDKNRIDNEILNAISKHYYKNNSKSNSIKPEGKTVLIYENVRTFIKKLIELDMQYAPFEVIALEASYRASVEVQTGKSKQLIFLGGKIDRVDNVGGIIRVIDYKTGNVDSFSFSDVKELFDRERNRPKKELLQALLYSFFLEESIDFGRPVQPVIYSLRKFFDEKFSPEIKFGRQPVSFREVEEDFILELKALLEEIFSTEISFFQTSDIAVCRNCPYNKICQKY